MKTRSLHENNFDALRLLFASFVLFSHSFALLGKVEPVVLGRTLGNLGVHGFFVISGYLIVRSKLNASAPYFLISRALRIIPGLMVALYIANSVGKLAHHYSQNPIPQITDGPIWTLPWEAICYLLVLALGVIGSLSKQSYPAVLIVLWSYFIIGSSTGNTDPFFWAILPMIIVFFTGGLLHIVDFKPKFWIFIISTLGIVIAVKYSLFLKIFNPVQPYFPLGNSPQFWKSPYLPAILVHTVIYFLCFPAFVITIGLYSRYKVRLSHDLSYGLYIYAWPVAQVLVYLGIKYQMKWAPVTLALATSIITIPLAYLSCRLIEEPFMKIKNFSKIRSLK